MDKAPLWALTDGAVPVLPPLDERVAALGVHPNASTSSFVLPPVWRGLAATAPASTMPDSGGERGAAALLTEHVERLLEREDQARLIETVAMTLLQDPFDADAASAELADLLGYEHLELVSALLVRPSATGAQLRRYLALRAQGVGSAMQPLDLAPAAEEEERYPNVYASNDGGHMLTAFGTRFSLPVGTTREHTSFYEEVTVPPSRPLPYRTTERLIPLDEMDTLCRGAFHSYKTLNRLQSAVYPMAYKTNENLLVCAPTGAGKTDVAMLTVLQCIGRFTTERRGRLDVDRSAFKIVYVAPMKALVSEIVRKFQKRLNYLGLRVRELTGDMQLTRRELAETQMIVTTPEKWDVVTRRPVGDSELALSVRLLIIDEVHLLHEERGAVIETIVARTQRLVESTQSMIRIVGLSATLPNYVDVADFLGVNRYRGLFYFGSAFRPVPLEQHFVGVRGKHGSVQSRTNLDRVAYEKVLALVEADHPVMVFVHTRKDTVKTAQALLELGREDGLSELLTAARDDTRFERDIAASRNRELRELYNHGIGIHHAGMLRSDRDLSEKLFAAGSTRVLCCTATLAWGVNLPAYAVIIKGTDVYDAAQGRSVDLGILDVLQIFGRAGRPQYEDVGVSYICTSGDKLTHYIEAVTASHPIESTFLKGLVDALNAEIALGSVSSVAEGVSWLGFTYLYTRLRKAPLLYGLDTGDVLADPALDARRQLWVTSAARILATHGMIRFDEVAGTLHPTSVGRIASRYYLGHETIAIFATRLRNGIREADALDCMSRATDFAQIPLRDSEEDELTGLQERVPCQVPGGTATAPGKVNILLQAHISHLFIEDFALVSDARYVAQNAGRVLQALFELSLDRGFATAASAFLNLAKSVDKCVWPFEHPLRQYPTLNADVIHRITMYADDLEVSQVRALPRAALASLLRVNERVAGIVQDAAERFPAIDMTVRARPLPGDVCRLDIALRRAFTWDERLHGATLPIVVWVENAAHHVVYSDRVALRPTPQPTGAAPKYADIQFCVYVPCADPTEQDARESAYSVAWASLLWLGADGSVTVPLDEVLCPPMPPMARLRELPLLSLRDVFSEALAEAYASIAHVRTLNALQTQVFHALAHTRANLLLCAAPGAGKRTVAGAAVWRATGSVLIVARDANAILARYAALAPLMGRNVRQAETNLSACSEQDVVVATPAQVPVGAFSLIVLHDVNELDAMYELAVMQLRRTSPHARFIATGASVSTTASLAEWLHVAPPRALLFSPGESPHAVATTFDTVDIPYSDMLVRAFVKPALDRILAANGPALLFAPTRAQCMTAASELLARSATLGGLSDLDSSALDTLSARVRNADLAHFLRQGVAVWHASLSPSDRRTVCELYDAGCVRVVICARDVPVPLNAPLVVVLGTQYAARVDTHPMIHSHTRIAEYSVPELLRMQAHATRPGERGEFVVLCQQARAATLAWLLRTPLALESELGDARSVLVQALVDEVGSARVRSASEAVAWLSTSFLAERVRANPVYYGVASETGSGDPSALLSALVDEMVGACVQLGLLLDDGGGALGLTRLALMLPPGGAARLCTLSDEMHRWHVVPESVRHVLDRYVSDAVGAESLEVLRRISEHAVLEAYGVASSKRGSVGKLCTSTESSKTDASDAGMAGASPDTSHDQPGPLSSGDMPSRTDGPHNAPQDTGAPPPVGAALLALWLSSAHAPTGEKLLRMCGAKTAAHVSEARDELLVRLAHTQL